jgi:hypothetical protein
MKTIVARRQRLGVWLGVACLGLVPLRPLSAQEPNLRDTLRGHSSVVFSVAYSPDGEMLPKKDAGTDIEKLAQARVDAAHKAYDVAVQLCKQRQPSAKLEDVYTWSARWLNAQRDLSSKKEDHLAALSEHLRRMQELAEVAGKFAKAGLGSPLDSPAAEYYLHEAELWLAQAKASAKSPRRPSTRSSKP